MSIKLEDWLKDNQENLSSGTHWVQTLDDEENDVCLRTWAINKTKKKGIRVKEVVRLYLNGTGYIYGDLYFYPIYGYKVLWETKKYSSSYYPQELDDHWYKVDNENDMPNMSIDYELFSPVDCERLFSKYIPYYVNADGLNVMKYAKRYKNNSSAELLAKNGLGWLVMDKRCLKMSKSYKKKFLTWLRQDNNYNYIVSHKTIFQVIQQAIKRGLSIEKFYYEQTIDRYLEQYARRNIETTREHCEVVYDYLNNPKHPQNIGLHDYLDYLEIAKESGMDMTLKATLFPYDCARVHDTLSSRKKIKENRELNKKLKTIYSDLSSYSLKQNDLSIVFPKTQKDFVKWGERLHICVGTYGYDKKMAKGDCIICAIYQNKHVIGCCELQKKQKGNYLNIIQLRGEYNKTLDREKEAKKLINKFIGNIKTDYQKIMQQA